MQNYWNICNDFFYGTGKQVNNTKDEGESKVMQHFGNMRQNSATPDAFIKIVTVTNHTGLLSSPDTLRVVLAGFASMA